MMNDIFTIDAEKEDLATHVDLCAQRYSLLEKRLTVLELKVDGIATTISQNKDGLSKVIIGATATIVSSLLGVIVTLLMKF